MKAKNNNTGEIVTHFNISSEYGNVSYVDSNGVLRISNINDGEWSIIEEPKQIDWNAFRMNAAKEIAASISMRRFVNDYTEEGIAKLALKSADELIRQLKMVEIDNE
jgi:hypothetical protein